jgi:hypothetical protein
MAIKARFKGDPENNFFNDVPARDLSEEEYDALDTELKHKVRHSDLYDVVPERRATKDSE